MRVGLSICQPFAWAIVAAGKRCENRSWSTRYRGELWLHASTNRTRYRHLFGRPIVVPQTRREVMLPALESSELAWGAVVARCRLVDCVPITELVGVAWAEGPWCWILDEVAPLPAPIPCRGKQGLFPLPELADSGGPR